MVLTLLLSLSSLLPLSGYTIDLSEFERPVRVVGRELIQPEQEKVEIPEEPAPPEIEGTWVYLDDTLLDLTLWEGSYALLSFSPEAETLEVLTVPEIGITERAQEAVDYAPSWLRNELIDNFHRLDSAYQDLYADVILQAPDLRIVDEVAFQVAHISPEILMDSVFDPELITINASLIYEYADSLPYVNIIDYGLPPWYEYYYSNLGYFLIEDDDTVAYLLPSSYSYYYYYVVHPELSDESPRMDDYVYNEFWREFYFGEVDSGFPILGEKLRDIQIVWDGESHVLQADRPYTSDDMALDVIAHWVTDLVPGGACGNRPIQPNVVIYEHNGNCGELQDALAAAARTALVPTTSVFTLAEDHTWNEFYIDGWHEYQVDLGFGSTHIDDPSTGYDHQYGGGKDLSSVMEWRSDGKVSTVTSRYSNTCRLEVEVVDQAGRPVDGARILLYSDYIYGGLSISCWGFTDERGKCDFELGDLKDFYLHINSPVGDYPPGADEVIQIIETSQTGAHYYKTFVLSGYVPAPRPQMVPLADSLKKYRILIFSVGSQLLHGYARARRNTGDEGFYHTYCETSFGERPHVIGYLVDSTGLYSYENEYVFPVIDSISLNRYLYGPSDRLYLILSNREALTTSRLLQTSIALYRLEEEQVGESKREIRQSLELKVQNTHGLLDVSFLVPQGSPYRIALFNGAGRNLKTLAEGRGEGVRRSLKYRSELPSGVYFLKLDSSQGERVEKVLWLNGGER